MAMLTFFRLACLCPVVTVGLQVSVPSIEDARKSSVWIVSQMRSGSSTMLSMMSATEQENQDGGEVFSLFEPCHKGDRYSPQLEKLMKEDPAHCADLVLDVTKCNFNEVHKLAKWTSAKTSNDHKPFSKAVAKKMCSKANVVAVKTVEPFALVNATWVLDANPHLKIIELIRDPRGIFSSQHGVGFSGICKMFKENMAAVHPRIHKVFFEKWVKSPKSVSKGVYNFLGMKWGEKQDDWLHATFNADCDANSTSKHNEGRYKDCHTDSASVAKKWKHDLSGKQKAEFSKDPDCRFIAKAYNFGEFDDGYDFASEDLINRIAEDE